MEENGKCMGVCLRNDGNAEEMYLEWEELFVDGLKKFSCCFLSGFHGIE